MRPKPLRHNGARRAASTRRRARLPVPNLNKKSNEKGLFGIVGIISAPSFALLIAAVVASCAGAADAKELWGAAERVITVTSPGLFAAIVARILRHRH